MGTEDTLRTKMSELHLYCNLWLQKVVTVKAAGATDGPLDVEVR